MKRAITLIYSFLCFFLTQAQFNPKYDVTIASTLYDELVDMGVDNSGNVYLVGKKTNSGDIDIVLVKCTSSSCSLIATYDGHATYSVDDIPHRLQVDGSGNCYITGSTEDDNGGTPSGKTEALALKYNSSGTLQWEHQVESTTSTSASASGAYFDAVFSGSTLYAVGYTYGGAAGVDNLLITRYTSTGTSTIRNYDNSFGKEKGYKVRLDGSTLYMAVLDNGSLEYYSIGTSFTTSTTPTLIGSYTTSWTSVDGMSKSGSNVAFIADKGTSTQVVMYNGSAFKSYDETGIDDPAGLIIDGTKAIVAGTEAFSTPVAHNELVIAGYTIATGARSFYARQESTPGSTNHQAFSSKAVGLFMDGSGDYIVPGNLVLDTNPNDGNPALSLYAGFVAFDNTGDQQGWSVYEVAVNVTQGMENASNDDVILAGSKLWVLCNPPTVNLGADVTEPYDPDGNSHQFDAGAGFSSYSWSTGGTSRYLSATEAGTYTVTVTNSSGCDASDQVVYSITPIDQTITWSQTIPTLSYGEGNYTLSATSTSGLAVSFSSSNNSIAEAIDNGGTWELQIKTPGSVTITASQAGNANYNAAAYVQKGVTVDYAKYYWVGNGGAYTDYANHWATTSGGSTFHTAEPDEYCDVIFDANSFSTSDQTISGSNLVICHDLIVSGVTHSPSIELTYLNVYGSVDFSENASFKIYSFGFGSDGTETIDFHSQVIDAGSLTERWTFFGGGTYQLTGNVTFKANYIDVTNFSELVVGSGVTFTTFRPITLYAGTSLTNNGTLIFESGANFLNEPGSSFSGNDFTFRRNTTFDASTGRYSIVGSPITNASTDALGSLVYAYDESVDFGSNDGLNRFVKVTTPEAMSPGTAYFSAYTGTIEVTGTPNTGSVNVSLDYSASSALEADYDGFNLVANPYPAGLSFQDFMDANGPDGTGAITGAIYLWVDGGSDAQRRTSSDYMTVNSLGSVGGNSARSSDYNGYLGSFQGFFVQATGTGQHLSFTEDMRFQYGSWDANFFRTTEKDNFKIRIGLESDKSRVETLIGYLSDASADFDPLYDARRFDGNGQLNLASILDGKHYAIQGRSIFDYEDEVALFFETKSEGQHQLEFAFEGNSRQELIYLLDKQTGQTIEIREDMTWSFYASAGAYPGRFVILRAMAPLSEIPIGRPFYVYENTLYLFDRSQLGARLQVSNLTGVILDEIPISDQSQVDLSYLSRGVYILISESQSQKIVIR